MSPLEKLRFEAAALETDAKASGIPISHCDALEQIAKQHGYESWRACRAVLSAAERAAPDAPPLQMRRYESPQWDFGIDVPQRWNTFPPVSTNSPYEVIRFVSSEHGRHVSIIFRQPCDPEQSADEFSAQLQKRLESVGYGNFVPGATKIGTWDAQTLDFNKASTHGLWSVRQYMVAADTLRWVVGCGSSRWDAMVGVFDRMAASFAFQPSPSGQSV